MLLLQGWRKGGEEGVGVFMALFTLLVANIWFPYLWKVYWLLVPAEWPPDLNQYPKSSRKLQGLLLGLQSGLLEERVPRGI